jgi:kinesin family protein 1
LLAEPDKRGKKELEIRQIAGKVWIPDATVEAVSSYKQIQTLMDKGDSNRSIGKTQLNATSSRAHTVVTITFKKITENPTPGKPPL